MLAPAPPRGCDLRIDHLRVVFDVAGAPVVAVDDASLHCPSGGALGLVGESGSGKSTLARAIVGLHSARPRLVQAQRFQVDDQAVPPADEAALRRLRGRTVAMVFQDPLTYLNPLARAGTQIRESVLLHDPAADPARRVAELLEMVRLPARVARAYPHELSGGMRQRVVLAIALGCRPRLLVADEPTTALDVSTQAEILALIRELRQELGMSLLLISHDLSAVADLCEHIVVMHAGRTVESSPADAFFGGPLHPYAQALLQASGAARDADGRFVTLDGRPRQAAAGCDFAAQCRLSEPRCHADPPPPMRTDPAQALRQARCWVTTAEEADR